MDPRSPASGSCSARPLFFEVLDLPLVLLGALARAEGAEVSSPARARINSERVKAIFSVGKLTNHAALPSWKS